MLYLSTDYVFNGQEVSPGSRTAAITSPLPLYGQTKLEGENWPYPDS